MQTNHAGHNCHLSSSLAVTATMHYSFRHIFSISIFPWIFLWTHLILYDLLLWLSPRCPLHGQTVAGAGRRWCPWCKWSRTGSRSAASSKCFLESGREKPSGLGWTTHSSSMLGTPTSSTAHTSGLEKEEKIWGRGTERTTKNHAASTQVRTSRWASGFFYLSICLSK